MSWNVSELVAAATPHVRLAAFSAMTVFFVVMTVVLFRVLLPGVRPALQAAKQLPPIAKTVSDTLAESQSTLDLANQTLLQAQGLMRQMGQNPLLVGSGGNGSSSSTSSAPVGFGFFRGG